MLDQGVIIKIVPFASILNDYVLILRNEGDRYGDRSYNEDAVKDVGCGYAITNLQR